MTTNCQKVILIATGGTGGHVMPAIALGQRLQDQNYKVHMVTDHRGQSLINEKHHFHHHISPIPQPSLQIFKFIRFISSFAYSFYLNLRWIWSFKPNVVVGFGGYMTLPTLLAAFVLRRPILIHEQNTVLGRVNRLAGIFVDVIALSNPLVGQKISKHIQAKFVLTGMPVRTEIADLRNQVPCIPFKRDAFFHILVLGGSQGAHFIDNCMTQAIQNLSADHQSILSIHHQCRPEHHDHVLQAYQQTAVKFQLTHFFKNMDQELKNADLIITRAGASTVAEISLIGKAALFIPFAYATDDHQTSNAQAACTDGRGWWRAQKNVDSKWLGRFINYCLSHPTMIYVAASQMRRYGQANATDRLTEQVIALCSKAF